MSKAIDKGGKKDEAVGDRGQHETETSSHIQMGPTLSTT